MDQITVNRITSILENCVNRAISRVKKDSTFRPFHEALLTKKLVAASIFERSFSTSFGQGPIEEISQILALSTGAECIRQKETLVNVNQSAVQEIERIISALRSGESTPNWGNEVRKIQAFTKGSYIVRRIISDLWLRKDGVESFISIKTVKPNIDQTERAKVDMLLLKAHDPQYRTYIGLYYNPGGTKRSDYNWSVPKKIIDIQNDPCILIGEDYWNFLGGPDTYPALIEIFKVVGEKTRGTLESLGH